MDIGVIGNEDFTLGFRMVGVRKVYVLREGVPDRAAELARLVGEAMADPEVGILVMRSDVFSLLDARLQRRVLDSIRPVFVPIGEVEDETLRERIKQAVGVDLWV